MFCKLQLPDSPCCLVGHMSIKSSFEKFKKLLEDRMIHSTAVQKRLIISTCMHALKGRMGMFPHCNPGGALVSSSTFLNQEFRPMQTRIKEHTVVVEKDKRHFDNFVRSKVCRFVAFALLVQFLHINLIFSMRAHVKFQKFAQLDFLLI